jgi:lysophospholipid acyltransferase (LPLAT)-like uncharacterized protein
VIPGRAVRLLFAALARTWRFHTVGEEHLAGMRRGGGGFVFALWHCTLLPLLWWHRRQDVTLLVSRHADGALLTDSATRLGYRVVRGSSTRGGATALRAMTRVLASGATVAVTPDGPVGPARVAKPGAVVAARQAQVPILPVAAAASAVWKLRSWDRLLVPRPFARIRVAYGPPLEPGSSDAPEHAARELARRLDAVSAVAADFR